MRISDPFDNGSGMLYRWRYGALVLSFVACILTDASTSASPGHIVAAQSMRRRRTTSQQLGFIRAQDSPPVPPVMTTSVLSLFGKDEREYERYAATLAATEPLRQQRDERAKQTLNPIEYWWLCKRRKLGGKGVCDVAVVDPRGSNTRLRAVCQNHVRSMSAVIKAMGMTVPEFNALSKKVAADEELRSRVMQQAYYYRVAAQLSPHSIGEEVATALPPLQKFEPRPLPPQQKQQPQQQLRQLQASEGGGGGGGGGEPQQLSLQGFARCVRSVERLRRKVESELKEELHIEGPLPDGLCDPSLMPLLNPKARALCQSFPDRATNLIKSQGVDPETFNAMLESAGRNPLLRWRLARLLKSRGGIAPPPPG